MNLGSMSSSRQRLPTCLSSLRLFDVHDASDHLRASPLYVFLLTLPCGHSGRIFLWSLLTTVILNILFIPKIWTQFPLLTVHVVMRPRCASKPRLSLFCFFFLVSSYFSFSSSQLSPAPHLMPLPLATPPPSLIRNEKSIWDRIFLCLPSFFSLSFPGMYSVSAPQMRLRWTCLSTVGSVPQEPLNSVTQ